MVRKLLLLISGLVIISLVLVACAPAGPPAGNDAPVFSDDPVEGDKNDPGDNNMDASNNDHSEDDNDDANGNCQDCENDGEEGGEGNSAPANDFVPEPVAPQPIQITTTDNRTLEGMYYPPGIPDAPVTVLMHWAKGDLRDWDDIAPWLQNRPDELPSPLSGDLPPLPEGASFGVVVFNFGGYGNSVPGAGRESLVDDALSAVIFAATLPGIDPQQISVMGASIGADGVVDACYEFNMQGEVEGRCIGALSLSPGNYLTPRYTYNEAAAALDADGVPVTCLAAEGDYDSPVLCGQVGGTLGQGVVYSGSDHGMDLWSNPQTPVAPPDAGQPSQVVQEFYAAVWNATQ